MHNNKEHLSVSRSVSILLLTSTILLTRGLVKYILSKEETMKTSDLTLPEIALIAGTRGMLGAGVGLLLADKLDDDQRKSIGWTLLLIGAISTIPLVIQVMSKRR
jgi:hypothetical protein